MKSDSRFRIVSYSYVKKNLYFIPCISPTIGIQFSGSASEIEASAKDDKAVLNFFSSLKGSTTLGGKASLQPKRTPVTNEEIEAVLVCRPTSLHISASLLRIAFILAACLITNQKIELVDN